MKRVAFHTLGCKVNQYETEAIAGLFESAGYRQVDFGCPADVYVINTCTVTNLGDRKSRQMIRRARKTNPSAVVAVIGCYPQAAPDEVAAIPGVDIVAGTKERSRIVEYVKLYEESGIRRTYVGDVMKCRDFEELKVESHGSRTRAFLKIQEGCSQYCAYCIIPYVRGPIRSRQPADVLNEAARLAQAGFREIVLTGIHLASYGKDIKTSTLTGIVRSIHDTTHIDRIRLGSIEPTTITPDFIDAIAGMNRLCPHYHISLQSGCDRTLKRMNRKYTTAEYEPAVSLLRERIPDVSVTTDVMVGFPGETDADFAETVRFLERISLSRMHVFKYSPRKGTPAASFPGQVAPEVKESRSAALLEMSGRQNRLFCSRFTGRTMPVLFEQEVPGAVESGGNDRLNDRLMEGLTPNHIKVVCRGNPRMLGGICDVKLRGISGTCGTSKSGKAGDVGETVVFGEI